MKKYCLILDEQTLKKAQDNALKYGDFEPATIYNTSKFIRELLERMAKMKGKPNEK